MTFASMIGWIIYASLVYLYGMWQGIRYERERRVSRNCTQCERLLKYAYGKPRKPVSVTLQPPAQS